MQAHAHEAQRRRLGHPQHIPQHTRHVQLPHAPAQVATRPHAHENFNLPDLNETLMSPGNSATPAIVPPSLELPRRRVQTLSCGLESSGADFDGRKLSTMVDAAGRVTFASRTSRKEPPAVAAPSVPPTRVQGHMLLDGKVQREEDREENTRAAKRQRTSALVAGQVSVSEPSGHRVSRHASVPAPPESRPSVVHNHLQTYGRDRRRVAALAARIKTARAAAAAAAAALASTHTSATPASLSSLASRTGSAYLSASPSTTSSEFALARPQHAHAHLRRPPSSAGAPAYLDQTMPSRRLSASASARFVPNSALIGVHAGAATAGAIATGYAEEGSNHRRSSVMSAQSSSPALAGHKGEQPSAQATANAFASAGLRGSNAGFLRPRNASNYSSRAVREPALPTPDCSIDQASAILSSYPTYPASAHAKAAGTASRRAEDAVGAAATDMCTSKATPAHQQQQQQQQNWHHASHHQRRAHSQCYYDPYAQDTSNSSASCTSMSVSAGNVTSLSVANAMASITSTAATDASSLKMPSVKRVTGPQPTTCRSDSHQVDELSGQQVHSSAVLQPSNMKERPTENKRKSKTYVTGAAHAAHTESAGRFAVDEYEDSVLGYNLYVVERTLAVSAYLSYQPFTATHRRVLCDWMGELTRVFCLTPETLRTAIWTLDRFLARQLVALDRLQLAGAVCLSLSAKYMHNDYRNMRPPPISSLVWACDNLFDKRQIVLAERHVLDAIGWQVAEPAYNVVIARAARAVANQYQQLNSHIEHNLNADTLFATVSSNVSLSEGLCIQNLIMRQLKSTHAHGKQENMCEQVGRVYDRVVNIAYVFVDVALWDGDAIHLPPSAIAAGAVYTAMKLLNATGSNVGDWTRQLGTAAGYAPDAAEHVAQIIVQALRKQRVSTVSPTKKQQQQQQHSLSWVWWWHIRIYAKRMQSQQQSRLVKTKLKHKLPSSATANDSLTHEQTAQCNAEETPFEIAGRFFVQCAIWDDNMLQTLRSWLRERDLLVCA